MDVAQPIDYGINKGLKYKLKSDLPRQFYEMLKSYINKRQLSAETTLVATFTENTAMVKIDDNVVKVKIIQTSINTVTKLDVETANKLECNQCCS